MCGSGAPRSGRRTEVLSAGPGGSFHAFIARAGRVKAAQRGGGPGRFPSRRPIRHDGLCTRRVLIGPEAINSYRDHALRAINRRILRPPREKTRLNSGSSYAGRSRSSKLRVRPTDSHVSKSVFETEFPRREPRVHETRPQIPAVTAKFWPQSGPPDTAVAVGGEGSKGKPPSP
ncbi:hypothetical protein BHE74_00033613 [Ensete ventricosum]|uniref:Uncharacterized protein n=1 Tax=Ensete ventricosum TaxID=4639 RepID=A0A445MGQ8_ENSVE|nr:hypothetical protein BHE74_00033613 [Ensete ventricosum]RZR73393.1 hypothetical protein BHM03_00023385 [Ensete ventricosum]